MSIFKQAKQFFAHESGNIAITFAISFLPIMLSVGAAIDYSRASDLHTRVANATDAALLAAVASVMDDVDINDTAAVNARLNAEFEPFFLANMHGESSYEYNGYTISFDPVTKGVAVDVDIDYKTTIFGIVGMNRWEADVQAATGMQVDDGGSFSMFLVLDRSGSMNGSKMVSLKTAVGKMISNFEKADPKGEYFRMGAVAYDSKMWRDQEIDWDLSKTATYVNAMSARGGTNSSDAVNEAYIQLKDRKEIDFHQNKNGQKPQLIMVFMTDGNNGGGRNSRANALTRATCEKARRDEIAVYTVAFRAPKGGQALLEDCATDSAHYFQPENTDELINSFNNIGKDVSGNLVLSR
ncbi:MAG: VWA domain-containing protein [Hyphomicrobiales bacterium]|nr:VWA domain-containing protein [Hyphomicrobiales bacterium]